MTAYYNEIEPYAADWLENLIDAGHIAPGIVDRRSICDVQASDLAGFTQVHFFAGIGGWSLATRLAGWPDNRPLWTGSCPCQPFSVAGKQAGQEDARHLWPEMYRLISACRPTVVMGEQVAAAVGKSWLDGVCSDLERIDYACGAAVVPACAVDAPHRRDRLWFVADQHGHRLLARLGNNSTAGHRHSSSAASGAGGCCEPRTLADGEGMRGHINSNTGRCASRSRASELAGSRRACDGDVGDCNCARSPILSCEPGIARPQQPASIGTGGRAFWSSSEFVTGANGKARRVKPGVRLLAHGVPARVGKLRAFGNAIVPQVAAEILAAYLDTAPPAAPVLAPLP